ncbi:MAG: TonB family protein [Fibrobacteria bacterium]|nr:TonB family protein [Fibrobacteria bacterium]
MTEKDNRDAMFHEWPYTGAGSHSRLWKMITASSALHVAILIGFLLYPLFHKEKVIIMPIMDIVQLKPKIRPLQPKRIQKPITKPPTTKPPAPKLTPNPKPAITPKPVVKEVQQKPDTTKPPKEVVEKVEQQVLPKMVIKEMGDPRLRMWCRRVQKIIETRWNPPRGIGILGTSAVSIDFKVIRSGAIVTSSVGKSSGNKDLDGFALNTIERVGKLPPIPPNFREKDELDVNFLFHYQGE